MIAGVLRRSLPSRQTLSAAATGVSKEIQNGSCSSRDFISRFARDFHIRSEPPAGIKGKGSRDSKTVPKVKIASTEKLNPLSRKAIALKKEAEEGTSKIKGTRICIAIRSFVNPEKQAWCLPPHTRKVAMPDTRTLYTILRSPHVDKKSREQFEMRFKKRFLVIKAHSHELSKKLFWLKRYRILGAQYELQFHCKTRLDMTPVLANINGTANAQ